MSIPRRCECTEVSLGSRSTKGRGITHRPFLFLPLYTNVEEFR
jgi:hypothetical protein